MEFERFRQSSKRRIARMAGFYLSVVAFLFIWLMIFGVGMTGGFRVWFDPSLVDIHVVHNVTFFYVIWVFMIAMLVQLYKPSNRVTTMQMALLISIVALLENGLQFDPATFNPIFFVTFLALRVYFGVLRRLRKTEKSTDISVDEVFYKLSKV